MELDRNDEHFEEVLDRLDSLIRRGQPQTPPPPPPLVSEASIPVLTEIYKVPGGASMTDPVAETSESEKLEQAVAAVLPLMSAVLREALVAKVQPAIEGALNQVLDDLHPKIESILRQRLQTLLTQEMVNHQTEI